MKSGLPFIIGVSQIILALWSELAWTERISGFWNFFVYDDVWRAAKGLSKYWSWKSAGKETEIWEKSQPKVNVLHCKTLCNNFQNMMISLVMVQIEQLMLIQIFYIVIHWKTIFRKRTQKKQLWIKRILANRKERNILRKKILF